MDQQTPYDFVVEAFVDPSSVRDVVRGLLHTIFFHRFFPELIPQTRDVLDIALPFVGNAELETLIDQRTALLVRQLETERSSSSSSSSSRGARGQIVVQFFEKRRRKGWYVVRGGDEEVCWETWTVKVTVAEPRTESERAKVRHAMVQTLQTEVLNIVTAANVHKDHIPPITTIDANPFPYQITVNPSQAGKEPVGGGTSSGGGNGGNGGAGTAGTSGAGTTGASGPSGSGNGAGAGGWATRIGIY